MTESGDVTRLLALVSAGEAQALNRLYPLIYDELKRVARNRLAGERADHTLSATALVHETYLRLVGQNDVQWENRAHFFAVAAQAIRRILVDHARRRGRKKRGGALQPLSVDDILNVAADPDDTAILALDEALKRLGAEDPEKAEVVELRFFGGLTAQEVAAVRGSSLRTVERHWQYARAWLFRYLLEDLGATGSGS